MKACSKKGCKRTRPADHPSDTISCNHILNAQDQWRELFILKFNRAPPNIFDDCIPAQLHVTDDAIRPIPIPTPIQSQIPITIRNDAPGDYGLPGSFFEQAMELDLSMSADATLPATPPLDLADFLEAEPMHNLNYVNRPEAHDITNIGNLDFDGIGEQLEPVKSNSASVQDLVRNLQEQVTAMENMLAKQAKEKDRVFSLQEQVVQLEQKLYQSSERERQLEATLEVIFDAFQATGAPQAQPNKPLWNLVMSHSSRAVGAATQRSSPNDNAKERLSASNSFLTMSPAMTFAANSKVTAQTPPDSTYGSVR